MADVTPIPLASRSLCRQCGDIYDARQGHRPRGYPGQFYCLACARARRRETWRARELAALDVNPELVERLAAAWQPVSCRVFDTTTAQIFDVFGAHPPEEKDPRILASMRVAAHRIGADIKRKTIAFAVARRHGVQEIQPGRFLLDGREYSARRLGTELIRRALHPN